MSCMESDCDVKEMCEMEDVQSSCEMTLRALQWSKCTQNTQMRNA